MTVAREPGTTGVEAKVAAFTTLFTVICGVGGAAATVTVTGIDALPVKGPASIVIVA
jgi:hypothetical protein